MARGATQKNATHLIKVCFNSTIILCGIFFINIVLFQTKPLHIMPNSGFYLELFTSSTLVKRLVLEMDRTGRLQKKNGKEWSVSIFVAL